MLSKHTSKASRLSPDGDSEHLKLPQYEKLEFDQLCSGFTTHLEKDFELNKSLLRLMRTKHEVCGYMFLYSLAFQGSGHLFEDEPGLCSRKLQPVAPKSRVIFLEDEPGLVIENFNL